MQKTAEEILKQTHGNISTSVIGTRLSLPYESLCYGSNLVTDHTYRYALATRDPVPFAFFQYTMDGCASFHHGRKDHDIPPGCAFITRTPSPCVYQQHPDYDSYHFVFFSMGGEGALALIDKIIERHGNVLALPKGSKVIDLLCRHINDLRAKGEQQFDAYEESIFAYQFLVTLWRELSPEKKLITEEIPEALVRVEKYIEKHLSNPFLDVSDMAREAKLSKWYFTRLFQKFNGTSPKKYLLARRLSLAMQILNDDSECHLKEVIERCGFTSETYFCYAFRRMYKNTPGSIRKHNFGVFS